MGWVRKPAWLVFATLTTAALQPCMAAATDHTGQGNDSSPYTLYSPPYTPQSAPMTQESGSGAGSTAFYRSPNLNPWASSAPGGVNCTVAGGLGNGATSLGGALQTPATNAFGPTQAQNPPGYNLGKSISLVPSVSLSEVYSDNITLAPDSRKQSDFVTELVPRLDACAETSRIKADLNYSLQGLYYAKDQSRNAIYNQLGADTTAELFPRHLYFSANTTYGQAVINPAKAYSTSNVLDTGNRTNVWTINLSPYVEQGLGPLGQSILRYTYGRVLYKNATLSDSTSNTETARLVSPETNVAWSWIGNFSTQRLQRSGSLGQRTIYFDTASLQMGYRIRTNFKLLAQGGIEDKYNYDGTTDRFASPFWNAGFRWATNFNDFEFRYGHRFFGPTYTAKWQLNAARLKTAVSYTEEPTESTNDLLNLRANQQNGQLLPNVPILDLSQYRIYISKRLSGNVEYLLGQTRLNMGGYSELREYRLAGVPSLRIEGADAWWLLPLGVRTALTPSWNWERYAENNGRPDFLQQELLTLSHSFSRVSSASLVLRHQTRASHNPGSKYKENAVIIEFSRVL